MSEAPITLSVLAEFHRKVILPDVERVDARLVNGRFDAIDAHFDAMYHRFERLETEYEAIKAGLGRVEQRLDRVEQRLSTRWNPSTEIWSQRCIASTSA